VMLFPMLVPPTSQEGTLPVGIFPFNPELDSVPFYLRVSFIEIELQAFFIQARSPVHCGTTGTPLAALCRGVMDSPLITVYRLPLRLSLLPFVLRCCVILSI